MIRDARSRRCECCEQAKPNTCFHPQSPTCNACRRWLGNPRAMAKITRQIRVALDIDLGERESAEVNRTARAARLPSLIAAAERGEPLPFVRGQE